MSLPKAGEAVKVTLRNGESLEGVVEWVDGNGAWVKGPQKSRWVPIETFLVPTTSEEGKKEPSSDE